MSSLGVLLAAFQGFAGIMYATRAYDVGQAADHLRAIVSIPFATFTAIGLFRLGRANALALAASAVALVVGFLAALLLWNGALDAPTFTYSAALGFLLLMQSLAVAVGNR